MTASVTRSDGEPGPSGAGRTTSQTSRPAAQALATGVHHGTCRRRSGDFARASASIRRRSSGDADAKAKDLNARLGNWIYAVAPYKANALKTKLADVLEAPKDS